MYRVIIYGCPDKFSVAVYGKEFNRRGLIRFLSRHVNKLVDYDTEVAVSRDHGPACPVNFFFVGKKHMSDRIPTHLIVRLCGFLPHMDKGGASAPRRKRRIV